MCCPRQLESGTGDEIITDWLTCIWFVNHIAFMVQHFISVNVEKKERSSIHINLIWQSSWYLNNT
jgi:hypothetical protein